MNEYKVLNMLSKLTPHQRATFDQQSPNLERMKWYKMTMMKRHNREIATKKIKQDRLLFPKQVGGDR
jgi:hypothetical protein